MNQIALNAQSEQTMTSREIADLTLSTHDTVLKTIRRHIEQGIVSPTETPYTHQQNGQTYMEYRLGFRDAMFIASGYSPNLRARIIDRWMELEQKPVTPPFAIPATFADALRLAADQQETIQQQAAQLAIAAPAKEFHDKFVSATTGSKKFREVCKLLRANERAFWTFLEETSVMYRLRGKQMAYQNHIDAGRFEVKAGVNDAGHAFNTVLFTPKGIIWITGEWAKWQLPEELRQPAKRDSGVISIRIDRDPAILAQLERDIASGIVPF